MKDLIPLLDALQLIAIKEHLLNMEDQLQNSSYKLIKKLLEVECEYKKSRSLSYRLELARIPSIRRLSDTSQSYLVEKINMQEVIRSKQNIILIGGSGSAKTHLATGLALGAIEDGYRIRFYCLHELASAMLHAAEHNNEVRFILSLQRFDLIIIDELGYMPIKDRASGLLYSLFTKLYEQTSIIITTHLRFEEWGQMFGNAKTTKVVIDRLTHHCKIIETGNKSFRGGSNM